MYSTCLFCTYRLGANEVLETFPIGRRLAFDAAKGRLWVVCRKCEKWNLSPFEERWEAIEDSERLFQDARKRVASENIGLARLDEGLELVRIGEPLRPEFAAWRYGDQFGRRRRRAIMTGVGIAAVGGAAAVAGAATGVMGLVGWWAIRTIEGIRQSLHERQLVAQVPALHGESYTVRGRHLREARLYPDIENDEGWRLSLAHEGGTAILTGWDAVNATALVMPKVNRKGAPQWKVQRAVKRLESFDNPFNFLHAAAHVSDSQAPGHKVFPKLPLETRLAIEMAANEENERIVMEGDLALLELDWKEAEEVAAIADRLLVPRDVEAELEKMRAAEKRGEPRFIPRAMNAAADAIENADKHGDG